MQITKESHVDHLNSDQLGYIADLFAGRDSFFIERVEMPPALGTVPCGLYGPLMGDGAIPEDQVSYGKRGERTNDSRLVDRPMRPVTYVTVIAGPHEGKPCVLYTVFGGPLAPREPSDPTLETLKLDEFRARQVALLQVENPTDEQIDERRGLAKKVMEIDTSKAFWREHALASGK